MCGPAIGVIGSLVGGAVSAMGSIYAGKAQAAAYKAQALAEKYNAQAKRMGGQYEASRLEDRGQRLIAQQVVGYASEGLEISGSALDVISDTRSELELDKLAIRTNAENEARGHDYAAAVAQMNAKSAKQAGQIGAVSAMIGGITSAASYIPSGGIGSAFTGGGTPAGGTGASPTGLGTPKPAAAMVPIPQPRPFVAGSKGNIPIYATIGGVR